MPDPEHPDVSIARGQLATADAWEGFPRDFITVRNAREMERIQRLLKAAEGPTFEERKERCELMGMVFCTCTRVQTGEGETVIYNPACKVCNQFVKLP